jgi:hypothetical protein
VTALHQKLNQLSLTTVSRQLDQMISEASAKNLSLTQALEALADLELESRNRRSIERRFRLSRLHAQHSIDSFHFKHHKSRMELKQRILRLLDLEFLANGTSVILIGNPGVGKTFLAKVIAWRACQANQRVLFTTAMDMLNQLLASQVDHSLIRKLRIYTEPTLLVPGLRRTGLPVARSAVLEPLLPGHLDAPQPQAFHGHHHEHRVFRLGQHPVQHHHRHGHRRPAGGELRDLPAGRRQSAQGQQALESAGRVIRAGFKQAPRCAISRLEESAG